MDVRDLNIMIQVVRDLHTTAQDVRDLHTTAQDVRDLHGKLSLVVISEFWLLKAKGYAALFTLRLAFG